MKKLLRTALLAGSALAIATPAGATNSWGGYHWAGNGTTVTLKVNSAVRQQWESYVDTAISDWDSSSELSLGTRSPVSSDPKRCNAIPGQILVCNYSYGQRGWLGIANIWLSGLHITQATTKLNDTYFNMAKYNTSAWKRLVSCQEIGHDFGLDHQDETFNNFNKGTCMDYTNAPAGGVLITNGVPFDYGPSNEYPNQHDYDELAIIYDHDDGFTTATASVSTNFGIRQVGKPAAAAATSSESSGDGPTTWGRSIHRDALGRPDIFEKALSSGRKMLTHVFWAPEATGHEAD